MNHPGGHSHELAVATAYDVYKFSVEAPPCLIYGSCIKCFIRLLRGRTDSVPSRTEPDAASVFITDG